jgi:hypothetical protein
MVMQIHDFDDPIEEIQISCDLAIQEDSCYCSNPWCPICYGQAPRIVSDGNYSP